MVKCSICQAEMEAKLIFKHRLEVHGIRKADYGRQGKSAKKLSAIDRIAQAQLDMEEAIRDLDAERDELQKRLVQIDNLQAAYKHFVKVCVNH